MLSTSREYLSVRVTADVDLDEQPVEIGVKLDDETTTTWYPAVWAGDVGKARTARILVGPGGSSVVTLPVGVHTAYVRLTDSPELPAMKAYSFSVEA